MRRFKFTRMDRARTDRTWGRLFQLRIILAGGKASPGVGMREGHLSLFNDLSFKFPFLRRDSCLNNIFLFARLVIYSDEYNLFIFFLASLIFSNLTFRIN